MFQHPKSRLWDKTLRKLFDEIDDSLEERYKDSYPLHPNRPVRGATMNKSMDGLFQLEAAFSAGYGSQHGRGYVIEIHLSTLSEIAEDFQRRLEHEVQDLVTRLLPKYFPNRTLQVARDGLALKIYGDLSLGKV